MPESRAPDFSEVLDLELSGPVRCCAIKSTMTSCCSVIGRFMHTVVLLTRALDMASIAFLACKGYACRACMIPSVLLMHASDGVLVARRGHKSAAMSSQQ